MNTTVSSPRGWFAVSAWSALAFCLLTFRFSPNWWVICQELNSAKAQITTPAEAERVDRAILSAYWTRGFYVTRQAADITAQIDDPDHKIVRWRLLIPAISRLFDLPSWVTLGLAHVGCLCMVLLLVDFGRREASAAGRGPKDGLWLALIAGSTAPFFTSMGLLGYYDSWLGAALLVAACTRNRGLVLVACALGPWIDERFVLGLPLALWVRWLLSTNHTTNPLLWARLEALWPLTITFGYALVRLSLGGTEGSQTVAEYLRAFVFSQSIPINQRLFGAWAGLRFGWLLILVAVWGLLGTTMRGSIIRSASLAAGVMCTAAVGLFSALDMSRSMVLLLPVLPLGYRFLLSTPARPIRWGVPMIAACALLLPAAHVIGQSRIPADNFWTYPRPLLAAQNNLGVMYASGNGVRANLEIGIAWLTKAAEGGSGDAQRNLGYLHEQGTGFPRSPERAAHWYHRAAGSGNAQAHHDLSRLHDSGRGVPKDPATAMVWRKRAAELGSTSAQNELGVAYANGAGVPRSSVEAVRWYRQAAEGDDPVAQFNLGMMLARGEGVPRDLEVSARWMRLSASRGNARAQHRLATVLMEGAGVEKKPAEALNWYIRSASQGLPEAQNDLGALYATGRIGPPNPAAAVEWYRLAADQGHALAQFNLGVMYAAGSGIPRNLLQAYRWMASAFAGGVGDAQQHLEEIERALSPEERAEALRLIREAASAVVPKS